jgi:hypothetical protein
MLWRYQADCDPRELKGNKQMLRGLEMDGLLSSLLP